MHAMFTDECTAEYELSKNKGLQAHCKGLAAFAVAQQKNNVA
jgi:hypothetical protein